MAAKRLPPQPHEWIRRDQPISLVYEGRRFDAYEGDVVSSALLANDQLILARSFKYHRPRGVLSMANHDANVLVHVGYRTNVRADVEPVVNGRSYRAVNTFGSLRFDIASALQVFAPVLPTGFYYKAFYRPRFLFPWWEKLIRHLAGLGKVRTDAPERRYTRRNRFCDVLIIGAGPAGLAAASQCIDAGLDVVIADENPRFGGTLDYLHANDAPAQTFKSNTLNKIDSADNCEAVYGHFAAGFYADHCVPLVGPTGLVHVSAKSVIVATGVYEQPSVFRNNDVPGVMLASGAQRLVNRFAVSPGEANVVIAGNDEGYRAALDLHAAGVPISAIADLDDPERRGDVLHNVLAHGIQVIPRASVTQAIARRGRLAAVDVLSQDGRTTQRIDCDSVLSSVGWVPAAGLLYQAGATLSYDAALGQVVPESCPDGVFVAGRLNGVFDLEDQFADGYAAGADAIATVSGHSPAQTRPPRCAVSRSHDYPIVEHPKGKDFVDFDEDLQVNDLRTAYREGFDSAELMKRYSTIGMGPSQGKVSNMNGVRVLAKLRGSHLGPVGVTTPRPFTHPVPMGVLGGRRLRRQWLTPMHDYHRGRSADLQEAGTWLRPMSYVRGSPREAIEREYRMVRERVGMIDVSTLGKIEIFGPDAIALLEYAYTCAFDKLKPLMTRYIFMVDGSGTLVDDGVAGRLADDHFYITATSSHAQAVVRQLQQYADQLDFEATILDRTFQVAALNLAGPDSRRVLERVCDVDVGEEAFPYLALREGQVVGAPARIMRVGFVGELGYEIHVPASHGAAVWSALMEAGQAERIGAFGVETQRLLRLEKGHLIFGQDTDGTTNPYEVNLGWGVRLAKPRFVGKHSLTLLKPRLARRLVGFIGDAEKAQSIQECHLAIDNGRIVGRVTSVGYSPHRRAVIGLAMIDEPLANGDRPLSIRVTDGEMIEVNVCSTPFYDPDNERQKMPDAAESQS